MKVAVAEEKFSGLPFMTVDCTPPGTSCQDHMFSVRDVRVDHLLKNTSLAYTNENAGDLT